MLTVRAALKFDVLQGAKVVGGRRGLDNVVQIANIMETPEVATWMRGGEFLISAGYTFRTSSAARRHLISELSGKGVAALGIRPGKYFTYVPKDMIKQADAVDLPLIELPSDVPYIDIMLPILEFVMKRGRHDDVQESERVRKALLEAFFSDRGMDGVCRALSSLVGNPVLLVGADGGLLAGSVGSADGDDSVTPWLEPFLDGARRLRSDFPPQASRRWRRLRVPVGSESYDVVVVPVALDRVKTGYLLVVENRRLLDVRDLVALGDASMIITLEAIRKKAVFETEKQMRGELLEDLITGKYHEEQTAVQRARRLDFDLSRPCAIFVVGVEADGTRPPWSGGGEERGGAPGGFFHTVAETMADYPGGALFMHEKNCVTGLVNVPSEGDEAALQKGLGRVLDAVKGETGEDLHVSAGVGRSFVGLERVRECYEEAKIARKVGRSLHGPFAVTFFRELGPYVLLYELRESAAARTFCEDVLRNVVAHDKENGTELLKTLSRYFRHDGNLRLTADSLFLHRNSVAYRLKIIERLTGLQLGSSKDRFSLQLCLKLAKVWPDSPIDFQDL